MSRSWKNSLGASAARRGTAAPQIPHLLQTDIRCNIDSDTPSARHFDWSLFLATSVFWAGAPEGSSFPFSPLLSLSLPLFSLSCLISLMGNVCADWMNGCLFRFPVLKPSKPTLSPFFPNTSFCFLL
ncbi:hypothetical protein V8C42DRAFT_122001 [Trichoderma barbatum]